MWFAARMLLEGVHTPPQGESLFEDRIVLLNAEDAAGARRKAKSLARRIEAAETFETLAEDRVTWRVHELLDVKELLDTEIGEGSEVYSAFLTKAEASEISRMQREPIGA